MKKLVIQGGYPLNGSVKISGSKNASLPILFASLLASEPLKLRNLPFRLRDINNTLQVLKELDVKVEGEGPEVTLSSSDEGSSTASYKLVSTMRASVCTLGPLLARRGFARVSLPGGCAIGVRPIDLHLKGLAALGADISIRHGYVEARAKKLRGTTIFLGGRFGSSVLGTANVMMAATRASGTTRIEGAACEPEIASLAEILNLMGAKVYGAGSPSIEIEGCEGLMGADFTLPPDRIEAGTYVIAGILAGGEVKVEGCEPKQLLALFDVLKQMGARYEIGNDSVTTYSSPNLQAVDVATFPYPGFPTDLQAQLMTLLCKAPGISILTEKVYPDRFMHVAELARFGAHTRKDGANIIVEGGKPFSGAAVMASDLRASACLVLAGLVAEGTTEVRRVYHLDRGYEQMEVKLAGLGADIRREEDKEENND